MWPAVLTALLLLAAAMGFARAAPDDILYVQDSGVAARAAPRPDAPVLFWLDRGARLYERERRAGWVRVDHPNLRVVGREAWLPGAAVAAGPPRAAEAPDPGIWPRERGEGAAPAAPLGLDPHRIVLALEGSPTLAFRATCKIFDATGQASRYRLSGRLPEHVAIEAARAASCIVDKRDVFGRLRAALAVDGRTVAIAETALPFGSVRVRTDGPWGGADARSGRRHIVVVPRKPPADEGAAPAPVPTTPVPPFSNSPAPPMVPEP